MSKMYNYLERASHTWTDDSIRLILTPSNVAKSIFFYIQEAGYFKTKAPYFTERQNLDSFLIVYTISGRGILRYEGNEYMLDSRHCFYINCMNHHYYETLSNNTWEFIWIHFNGNNALGYYNEFIKNDFKILNMEDTFFIESNLRRIISINRKKDISTEINTSNLITNILSEILILTATNEAKTIYIPEHINSIMKYIDQHFHTAITLDDIEKELGISKFHLSKEFKKYTGSTIGEYILSTRLSFTKELLKYSNLSITEIAYQSGMNHVSHFINLFKTHEGTTPLAFRKEWRI
ncbi:MAG: AraC family transcriptional regulator [Lachnotalea sp.]